MLEGWNVERLRNYCIVGRFEGSDRRKGF